MKKALAIVLALMLCVGSVSFVAADEMLDDSGMKKNGRSVRSADEVDLYDVVTFGHYPQSIRGNYSDIEWIVIGISGNRLQLLSRYALDSKKYHEYNTAVSWQESTLFDWLNDTFLDKAFTADEQRFIYSPISLLTKAEARKLPKYIRICESTAYAVNQGADPSICFWWLSDDSTQHDIQYNGQWWTANCACAVIDTGEIGDPGYQVNYNGKTVRPTLVVDLTGSSSYSEPAASSAHREGVLLDGEKLTSTDRVDLYDIVTFGSYPQTTRGDMADIEWIVTGIDGSRLRLLSRYALDSKKYHNYNTAVSWQESSLFTWLNGDFLNTAFTSGEQKLIYSPVSLPSVAEAKKLPSYIRICSSTAYAVAQGADMHHCIWWLSSDSGEYQVRDNEWWWSDTRTANCASAVLDTGEIGESGYQVNYNGKTVRPTLVVDLNGAGALPVSDYGPSDEMDEPVRQTGIRMNGRLLTSTSGIHTYDVVTFGNYPQSAYGDDAPIEWIVIGVSGSRMMLLSRYALDSKKYHNYNTAVSWQESSLYAWLNSDFLDAAFTWEEQTLLFAPVSLPSVADAKKLPASVRVCTSTAYAVAQGADPNRCIWWLCSSSGEYQVRNNEWWWSDTRTANCASAVLDSGKIGEAGYQVNYNGKTVRPVIIIAF